MCTTWCLCVHVKRSADLVLMCFLIRISDEHQSQTTAQSILGLAHLCMIDNMAPHTILCSSTHVSHIIMCWNSAEWVVSVVSHLQLGKKCRKTCSDRQQLLPPLLKTVEFWESRGRDREWLFSPLFSFFGCPVLCDSLSDNKHCRRCRQKSTGCAKCQLEKEKSSSPRIKENRKWKYFFEWVTTWGFAVH